MAYADPGDAVTGTIAPAALWNSGVRDNLRTAVMTCRVRKSADEPLSSNTTLQDDDHLLFPVLANEEWMFRVMVLCHGGAGNIKLAWTFPTGGSFTGLAVASNSAGTTAAAEWNTTTSPTVAFAFQVIDSTVPNIIPVDIYYLNGANAGNVRLQWAQNSSNATATVVDAGATWWAAHIA